VFKIFKVLKTWNVSVISPVTAYSWGTRITVRLDVRKYFFQ